MPSPEIAPSSPVSANPASDASPASNAAKVEETPSAAAPEAVTPSPDDFKSMLQGIKKSLEYHLAERRVSLRLHGRTIEIERWGLRKKLSLGTKVANLIRAVGSILPVEDLAAGRISLPAMLTTLHAVSDQVIDIIAASIVAPFKSADEAATWLDLECQLTDLFDLAVIVYDQNFGDEGDSVGKLAAETEGLTKRLQSLLNRS
jgi:hypothetical protein